MKWPLVRRSTHERLLASLEFVKAERDRYRVWHWNICDCHDAWGKCPCWSEGHPDDGSCDCCDLDRGGCGPRVTGGQA